MLLQIKEFLKDRSMASLGEIASHCDADPDAVQEVLQVWIQKGAVQKINSEGHCKGCSSLCRPTSDFEIYAWVGH
jgi:uncharacterized protein (DUF779 family)